ncbi:hypothetical protein HBH60_215680 [Parastagonospora nodorum]|nr:hypothetical protein HBH60_215680 [Parastagonospora nodorum]
MNKTQMNTAHGYGGLAKDMLKKAVVKRRGNATYCGRCVTDEVTLVELLVTSERSYDASLER